MGISDVTSANKPNALPTFKEVAKPLLFALGVILILGSLVAASLLYPKFGYASFAMFLGGGVVLGAALMVISKFAFKEEVQIAKEKSKGKTQSTTATATEGAKPLAKIDFTKLHHEVAPTMEHNNEYRIFIGEETLGVIKRGFYTRDGQRVTLNSQQAMFDKTVHVETSDPLPKMAKKYQTKFSVVENDTMSVLVELSKKGKNPVGINMANCRGRGGGFLHGQNAQEEDLCRRSTLFQSLRKVRYPADGEDGEGPVFKPQDAIYNPHVEAFRQCAGEDFAFMDKPQEVAFVTLAAYDLRQFGHVNEDRQALGLPSDRDLTEEELSNCKAYMDGTKAKIRLMLRIMAKNGHTHIVPGALGCGAFRNPPSLVAKCFLEVFQEEEFQGRFEEVTFAILKLSARDQNNIDAFKAVCTTLSN